jgi:enoyl-CoA hydratase/carnithine racemase
MDESSLLLQREPPVATVVLNRPETRNTLNEAMQRALPLMREQLRRWRRSFSQQATVSAVSRAIAVREE